MMIRYLTLAISLPFLIAVMSSVAVMAQRKQPSQKISGRVIARDAYLELPKLADREVAQFVIEIKSAQGENASSQFIKVIYEQFGASNSLPRGFFEANGIFWRFSLVRSEHCDQTVTNGLFVSPKDSPELPKPGSYILLSKDITSIPKDGSILPCFAVSRNGIEMLKE